MLLLMTMTGNRLLAIDLFCGLGGWAEGFLAEGYDVIGFDIEMQPYPAQLVIQDVLMLHGSQFKDATCIVASPPCQEFSYMAMPWKRAKQIERALQGEGEFPENYKGSRTQAELTALFDMCLWLQYEASEAAGRHIPMVVENVRGAQKWVGKAVWHYGSYYLWGDVPALMSVTAKAAKVPGLAPGSFPGGGLAQGYIDNNGVKNPGFRFDGSGSFQSESVKNTGGSWFNVAHNTTSGTGNNPDGRKAGARNEKEYGGDFGWDKTVMRRGSSNSSARKLASALIAKIPFPLARHVAHSMKEDR